MNWTRRDTFLLLQIILLALTPVLFAYALMQPVLVVTRIVLVGIWVFQIIALLSFIRGGDRKLLQFISIITNEEDYQLFHRQLAESTHSSVLLELNNVIQTFRKLKAEREADLLFFKHVMEHAPVGILAASENGQVRVCNKICRNMFGKASLNTLSQLGSVRENLPEWLQKLPENEARMLQVDFENRSLMISVVVTSLLVQKERVRVYSLKDIREEIDRTEMETWRKMMRILSHEVTNSISPVSIMSAVLQRNMEEGLLLTEEESLKKLLEESQTGLAAIYTRSKGLHEFVQSFRKLIKIPDPVLEEVRLKSLYDQSAGLMIPQLEKAGIKCLMEGGDLMVHCDPALLEQVLINLIKNSMEALREVEKGQILLSGKRNESQCMIHVKDNGNGIPEEIRKDIFTPFFTTKEEGSGIGLSFCKQVMKAHKGDLLLSSENGGAVFTCVLPAGEHV